MYTKSADRMLDWVEVALLSIDEHVGIFQKLWRDVSVHMYMYTKIADRTLSFPLIVVYQEYRKFAEV